MLDAREEVEAAVIGRPGAVGTLRPQLGMLTLENGIFGMLQPCRQFLAVQASSRGYVHTKAVA